MTPIGFVILINPFSPLSQTERLIGTLNRMFDHPPIVCHHDFGKNPQLIESRSSNVQLVHPHVNTKWADFSCIEAAVKALNLLYSGDNPPKWFIYLSGSDFPIKPASQIMDDLDSTIFDAHIEHLLVHRRAIPHLPLKNRLIAHRGPDWPRAVNGRYQSVSMRIPWITRRFQFTMRTLQLQHPFFTAGHLPFTRQFNCFGGEAWFCANHRAAQAIIESYTTNAALVAHFRTVLCPEESYFHTVLGNASGLRLSQDPLRYMDWTVGGNHPKILAVEDIPRLTDSNAHFARKFAHPLTPEVAEAQEELTSL